MRWPAFLLVLAVAIFALFVVGAGYVVWTRIVGLDPTLAKRANDVPRLYTAPAGAVVGGVLGTGLKLLPSMQAGLAAVVLVASSAFAGLLLFELYAAASERTAAA